MALSAKHQRFVEEYLKDLNATQAYLRAGYKANESSAAANGNRLLRNDQIQAAIAAAQAERSQRVKMEADEVLIGLTRIARFDIRGIFNEDGTLKPIHELSDDVAYALSSVDVVTKGRGSKIQQIRKIRTCSKERALELLGKHHGVLQPDESPDDDASKKRGVLQSLSDELLKAMAKELADRASAAA